MTILRHKCGSAEKTMETETCAEEKALSSCVFKWDVAFSTVSIALSSPLLSLRFLPLFSIKLLIEQEDEEIDVDSSPIKKLHHCNPFILQLEKILRDRIRHTVVISSIKLLLQRQ